MPELPEVECVRRTLAVVVGGTIESATVWRRDHLTSDSPAERRRPLVGATIDRIDRHGKELALIERGPRRLRIRLGMTGRMLVEAVEVRRAPRRVPHEHVRWWIRSREGGRLLLRCIDPRRFGDLVVFTTSRGFLDDRSRLGPDARSIEAGDLGTRLAATRRSVKTALLDQRVLAGIGNIYADEALHRARIHPRTPADRLDREAIRRLAEAIGHLLEHAIDAGGTTVRDYRNGLGKPGRGQHLLEVYGRHGERCRSCGGRLVGEVIGQRSTVWCPNCQQLIHTRGD